MRIAHIMPQHLMQMGGLQVFVHNIAKQQVLDGHEVFVITNAYPGKSSDYPYELIKVKPIKGFSYLYYFYKIFAELYLSSMQKKYQFDVWQINGGYPYGVMLADFFCKHNIPSVLRCSGDDIQISYEHNYGVRRNPQINKLVERNYYKFDKVVAITNTVVDEYKGIGIPAYKIELISNGVDVDRISTNASVSDVRSKHCIPATAKIILSVGRHHPKKNYNIIPEIIRDLIANNLDVYWIVLGNNSDSKLVQGLDRHISDRIILVDELSGSGGGILEAPADELIDYYRQSDIFAMTSALETFGIVIIEAMASALPIVCFDAPGVRHVMNKDCGYICELNNIEEFKINLKKLITDDNSEFSKKSKERAQQYNWKSVAKKYQSMYENI